MSFPRQEASERQKMQGTGTVFPMDTSLLHSVGKKSQQEGGIEGDRLAHLWGEVDAEGHVRIRGKVP